MVEGSLSMHKAQSSVLVLDKLGVAVHACNPGALKTETGGSEAEVRFRHRVSSSLGFVKHCFKRQNKQTCTCAHSGTLRVFPTVVHLSLQPMFTSSPAPLTPCTLWQSPSIQSCSGRDSQSLIYLLSLQTSLFLDI